MKNIQMIAPASYVPSLNSVQLDLLAAQFKKIGYNLCFSDFLFEKQYFLAGCDEIRLKDLENAFLNPRIDAVLALRGGEGSMRLLDKIDYKKIKRHPKIFIGFSDTTAFQNALWKKAKIPSYTGFVGRFGFSKINPQMLKNLKLCLENKIRSVELKTIQGKNAQGILLGGNLSVFCALFGTPFLPDLKNNVLLLEEANEPAYHLDRMFNQLHLSGTFNKISALILGDMTAGLNPKDKQLADKIIKDHLSKIKCPIFSLKNYSHVRKNALLPIGVKVKINSKQNLLLLDKIKNFD